MLLAKGGGTKAKGQNKEQPLYTDAQLTLGQISDVLLAHTRSGTIHPGEETGK